MNKIGNTPVAYVTTRPQGKHPAGSQCVAVRLNAGDKEILFLTFEDGDMLSLDGARFFLRGIEKTLEEEQADIEAHAKGEKTIWESMEESIRKDIDREMLADLFKLAN